MYTRYKLGRQIKSNLHSIRELSPPPPPDCIPWMYNVLDGPYSLGSWVRGGGGTVFPKGIRSAGPKIGPDRIPYDTGHYRCHETLNLSGLRQCQSVSAEALPSRCHVLSQDKNLSSFLHRLPPVQGMTDKDLCNRVVLPICHHYTYVTASSKAAKESWASASLAWPPAACAALQCTL